MARSQHTFAQVPQANIPRSTFNRSHTHKTTFNADVLVPIYVDEVLPGDTFRLKASIFGRLMTPLVPLMDNLYLDTFWFFVPNRLLWSNWQRFCGEQPNPGDSTDFEVPHVNAGETGIAELSLFDYMGIPTGINLQFNALFPRAYNLIWNEWFRDQNLQDSVEVPTGDGPDDADTFVLLKRGKRHDYFTSALPWPQKGPAAMISIGDQAPVISAGTNGPSWIWGNNETSMFVEGSPNPPVPNSNVIIGAPGNINAQNEAMLWGNNIGLVADLSQAEAATINDLRTAFQIQKLLERDARGGTRYTEILRAHFGVISPDARLQRPEFLGGGTIPISINPVTQTSSTANEPHPKGTLGAYGLVAGHSPGFTKSFVEHGVILGLAAVRADITYQQGLNRMWSRKDRYDYYWPAFAHLGEQPVYMRELYATGVAEQDNTVFGYQERFAEYRYNPSRISGRLNSRAAVSLDIWHLAEEFENAPTLSAQFIESNTPLARSQAVQDEPHILLDSHFTIACTRPMPTYSVPGLIDHF